MCERNRHRRSQWWVGTVCTFRVSLTLTSESPGVIWVSCAQLYILLDMTTFLKADSAPEAYFVLGGCGRNLLSFSPLLVRVFEPLSGLECCTSKLTSLHDEEHPSKRNDCS